MLRASLLCLALALPGVSAAAQEGGNPIRNVIESQIDAFLQDDFATAFTFASPMIKRMFQTPENFGSMVRNGYPMVWRPDDVRFLEQREIEGRTFQKVMVTDRAGEIHMLEYEMIRTGEGWQINGVRRLPAPDLGV